MLNEEEVPYELESHSFLLRVWLEEPQRQTAPPLWRGHITYLPYRERKYVQSCEDIQAFISNCVGSHEDQPLS